MDFASRLRILRAIAGKTQERLAHDCGRNGQSWIGNYESRKRLPRLDELAELADALGAPARALVTSEDLIDYLYPSHVVRLDGETLAAAAETFLNQKRFPADRNELLAEYERLWALANVTPLPGKPKRGGKDGLDVGTGGRTEKAAGRKVRRR